MDMSSTSSEMPTVWLTKNEPNTSSSATPRAIASQAALRTLTPAG